MITRGSRARSSSWTASREKPPQRSISQSIATAAIEQIEARSMRVLSAATLAEALAD